jgi:hypothetical protein
MKKLLFFTLLLIYPVAVCNAETAQSTYEVNLAQLEAVCAELTENSTEEYTYEAIVGKYIHEESSIQTVSAGKQWHTSLLTF